MTHNPTFTTTPASWYPDPSDPSQERYWDGTAWTAHVRPTATATAPPPPAYGAAPPPPPAYGAAPPYYPAPAVSTGNGYSTAAIVLGVIAFLFLPIVFGPIGLILGYVAKTKGEPRAKIGMTVAGIGMLAGMLVGALFAAATF